MRTSFDEHDQDVVLIMMLRRVIKRGSLSCAVWEAHRVHSPSQFGSPGPAQALLSLALFF